jgi:DNA-binding ferritin-like protein (Dps family)
VRDFPWVSRKSILTEDVLAFCDELRYQWNPYKKKQKQKKPTPL